jgi:hypothetical protein
MKLFPAFAPLLLASCASLPAAAPAGPGACPITGSSDWSAWVNAMPGPDARPTLIVTGKVTVPTGGYRFAWGDVRVMESQPVQVVTELRPLAPIGGATGALVTHDVRGEWPMSPPVGSVTVTCGDQTLARIAPVETAQ